MKAKDKVLFFLIAGSIIGGSVSAITKIGFLAIPAFTFSFLRFFIAAAVMAFFLKKEKIPRGTDFIKLLFISVLPILNVVFFVWGLRLTTAGIAAMLYSATPILTGIFSAYLISHRMSTKKWLSIFLGLAGVALVILLPLLEKGTPFSGNLKGNLSILTGVILWSLYLVYSKKLQKIYSPLVITSVFIFQAALVFFFLSLTEINLQNPWWHNLNPSSMFSLLYIAIPATVGAYLMGQHNVKLSGPVEAALGHYLMPISGYLFAFVLLGEKLTAGLVVGTILVFTSIWLTLYKS